MSELARLRDRVAELEDAMGLTAELPREVIPHELAKNICFGIGPTLSTPEGEAAFRARMAEMAEVAAWNGVGIQVDMFADEREPAEDRAFGEGRRAGMKGESNKPPYDPSVPQYAKWLDGYAEGNAVLFTEGFKRLVPAAEQAPSH